MKARRSTAPLRPPQCQLSLWAHAGSGGDMHMRLLCMWTLLCIGTLLYGRRRGMHVCWWWWGVPEGCRGLWTGRICTRERGLFTSAINMQWIDLYTTSLTSFTIVCDSDQEKWSWAVTLKDATINYSICQRNEKAAPTAPGEQLLWGSSASEVLLQSGRRSTRPTEQWERRMAGTGKFDSSKSRY